jgi:GMP synthase (glutamine-hydrolysing)
VAERRQKPYLWLEFPVPNFSGMSNTKKPVLFIAHREESDPGRVGQRIRARGHAVHIRRPCVGESLPETLEDFAGVVVFGGRMSANDLDAFIKREIDWLEVPLREEKPFFGICLGAQMLARHLGATVTKHPDGLVERGFYPLYATDAGRAFADWPEQVHHFHSEGFDLPAGAMLLARGDMFPNQAFAYGAKAYGVQFHPELTLAMVHRWTTRGGDRLADPGAQDRRAHLEGRYLYDHQTSLWLDQFLDRWLATGPAAG